MPDKEDKGYVDELEKRANMSGHRAPGRLQVPSPEMTGVQVDQGCSWKAAKAVGGEEAGGSPWPWLHLGA